MGLRGQANGAEARQLVALVSRRGRWRYESLRPKNREKNLYRNSFSFNHVTSRSKKKAETLFSNYSI